MATVAIATVATKIASALDSIASFKGLGRSYFSIFQHNGRFYPLNMASYRVQVKEIKIAWDSRDKFRKIVHRAGNCVGL